MRPAVIFSFRNVHPVLTVRLFDTGYNRNTDALDAHSTAVVAVRTPTLRVLQVYGELEALRILTDRRKALTGSEPLFMPRVGVWTMVRFGDLPVWDHHRDRGAGAPHVA
jgi:hypothetical protein